MTELEVKELQTLISAKKHLISLKGLDLSKREINLFEYFGSPKFDGFKEMNTVLNTYRDHKVKQMNKVLHKMIKDYIKDVGDQLKVLGYEDIK